MSLESLTRLRRSGGRPSHVLVFVGGVPNAFEDGPDTVFVQSNPAAMDWRPVVGLHVDVIAVGDPSIDLLTQTMGALDKATNRSGGLACKRGVVGLNEKHEEILRKAWRLSNAHPQ